MSKQLAALPIPDFYSPDNAFDSSYVCPDIVSLQKKAEAWRDKHGIKPSVDDGLRVHLLVIDDQFDFVFPEGSLYVAGRSGRGGMAAQDHLVKFIYRHFPCGYLRHP